jgi:hypothetical protein
MDTGRPASCLSATHSPRRVRRAGTGCNKVFTDVERLCNVHIPGWLATPGMGRDKIDAFYDDAVKLACDTFCADKAFYLRSFSINRAAIWHARRLGKFAAQLGRGSLRGERLTANADEGEGAAARRGTG